MSGDCPGPTPPGWKQQLLHKKVLHVGRWSLSIVDTISTIVNALVFPAMLIQMIKIYKRKEAKSFNPWFVTLQLLLGAPEGGVGAIIGFLSQNYFVASVGIWSAIYNAFILSFRLRGSG